MIYKEPFPPEGLLIPKGQCFIVGGMTHGAFPTLPFVSVPMRYCSDTFDADFLAVGESVIEFDDANPLAAPKVILTDKDGNIKEFITK